MHNRNGRSTMHNNGPSACAYERKERDGRRQARPPNIFAGMRHQARIGVSFEARKQEARKRYDRACAPAVSSRVRMRVSVIGTGLVWEGRR